MPKYRINLVVEEKNLPAALGWILYPDYGENEKIVSIDLAEEINATRPGPKSGTTFRHLENGL